MDLKSKENMDTVNEIQPLSNFCRLKFRSWMSLRCTHELAFIPCYICDALRDLESFVQFKKRENAHGGFLLLVKIALLNGCFHVF